MPAGTRNYIENTENRSSVVMGAPVTIDYPALPGIIHSEDTVLTVAGVKATRAQVIAAISKLSMLMNGGTHSDYLIDDLLMLNDFYGHTFVDGFLTQFFSQDFRENAFDAEVHAFVPGSVRKPRLRIHTKAAGVVDEIRHFLEVEGVSEFGRNIISSKPAEAVRPLIRHDIETITIKNTGDVATNVKFEATPEFIRSLNFQGANITRIDILADNVVKYSYDSLLRLNEKLKQSRAVAVPQADTWHINFELLGGSVRGMYQPEFSRNNPQTGVPEFFARDNISFDIYASDNTQVRLLSELYDTPAPRQA